MANPPVADSKTELMKMVGTVVGAIVLFIAFSDWMQYGNLQTCPTRHLRLLLNAIEQYRQDQGAFPTYGQEPELLDVYLIDKSAFQCQKGPKYIWPERPEDLSQGEHLLVSCPKATHGFLRTYAWGIEAADGKLRVVRVKNSGKRVPIDMERIKP